MATTTVEPYDDIFHEINTAQAIDSLAALKKHRIVGTPIANIPDLQRLDELEEDASNEWKVTAGVITYEGKVYVPKDDLLPNKVISLINDNLESSHFRALKSAELVLWDFH